jgi:ABC-2 type transport system permease protein
VANLIALIAFVLFAIAAVLLTSFLTGITLFGTGGQTQQIGLPADVTSLSGVAITPAGLVVRLLATVAYVVVSMLGVAAIALFFSTVTDSALGSAMGALAVLVTSQSLVVLDAANGIKPYLPTRYWLAWIDFFRDPVLWRDVERGISIQLVYLVVLLGAAWANFMTKDITS